MQVNKQNILFLSSWYPTRLLPFNGDFVKRHAKSISLYSNVICLHVVRDRKMKNKFEINESQDQNLHEIIIYFNNKFFGKILYAYYYLYGFKYIRKKFGHPDIIHGNVLIPIGFVIFLLSLTF